MKLITVKKASGRVYPRPIFSAEDSAGVATLESEQHVPAHRDFREKYFQGFGKKLTEEEEAGRDI
jgi:tRNA (guanine10-N2)-methyltransferase